MSGSTDLSPRVTEVHPGTPAELAGMCVGDVIVTVNGRPVRDIIEWHHAVDDASVSLVVDRSGFEVEFEISKQPGEQLGVAIASAVFDRVQTCDNHCPFCFIFQLPKDLRKSLYLKDDDYRLSFLFGNFTTLTRFTESDLERVIDQHLSPLHVSIHATNPWKRAEMLRNDRGAMSLRWLKVLLANHIEVRGQIVVCPGKNDGSELEATLADIIDQFSDLEAVALVPIGLSKFNPEPELRVHTPEEAARVVQLVEKYQAIAREILGRELFWASDEFYLLGQSPLPDVKVYGDFAMHEDGVGIVSCFVEEFYERRVGALGVTSGFFASVDGATPSGYRATRDLPLNPAGDTGLRVENSNAVQLGTPPAKKGTPPAKKGTFPAKKGTPQPEKIPNVRSVGVLTGSYAAPVLRSLLNSYGSHVEVLEVPNDFFGGNTAVAGLMVGADIKRVIADKPDFDVYFLPDVCLSEGRFLDGTTMKDLPMNIEVVATDGHALRRSLEKVFS